MIRLGLASSTALPPRSAAACQSVAAEPPHVAFERGSLRRSAAITCGRFRYLAAMPCQSAIQRLSGYCEVYHRVLPSVLLQHQSALLMWLRSEEHTSELQSRFD